MREAWLLGRVRRPLFAAGGLALTLVLASTLAAQGGALPAPAVPSAAEAAALAALPPYAPAEQVAGTVRLWGHGSPILDFMRVLVNAWESGFAKFQPRIRLEYDMHGTASAMGALYTGSGDVAILGQEIYPFETATFRKVKGYDPTEIEIATGSVDVRNFDFTIGAFVHASNPLGKLTLEQLDRVFAWHAGGRAENLLTWDQLGVGGAWAGRPIHLYGWPTEDVFSTFVEQTAMHGSHRWRCGMTRFENINLPDGTIYDSGQQILDALAKDPYGIALSNLRYLPLDKGHVKELAVSRSAAGPYVKATKATAIDRSYPLTRIIPAEIDRVPGRPVDPATREFLLYLLSRDGQAEIVRNGKYLPLDPAFAAEQREKLK